MDMLGCIEMNNLPATRTPVDFEKKILVEDEPDNYWCYHGNDIMNYDSRVRVHIQDISFEIIRQTD